MSDQHRRQTLVSTMVLAIICIGFLVAVWYTRPTPGGGFPKATQDGLGLLLAALVFILGFARDAQRHISATALETFRRNHDVLLEAWTSRELTLSSSGLMDLALRRTTDAAQFARLADAIRDPKTRRLVRLANRRDEIRSELQQLGYLLAYRRRVVEHADRSAADPDYDIPPFYRADSPVELARFRREVPRLEKDRASGQAKWRELEKAGGAGTAELVTGPARIRLATTTQTLFLNAHRFVIGMALLYVAGVLHAGPSVDLLSSPALWVATLVMVVALTYVRLVTRDVEGDLRFTAESVDQLPLILLARMELAFAAPEFVPTDEAVRRALAAWDSRGWWVLRLVETQVPGLTWIESVRGRVELALALKMNTHSERQGRERTRHLVLAEKHLQLAADDPLALLALSRTMEEMGNVDAAAALVSTAVQMLQDSRRWKPGEGWDMTFTMLSLVKGQRWMWPLQADAVDLLTQVTAVGADGDDRVAEEGV